MDSKTNKKTRTKKPMTFLEQVDILINKNLKIKDREEAIQILSRINYYRLSAYMLSYKKYNQFENDVSIKDIYEIYEFDKRFRNLVMGLLESVEIAFRTQIAYTLAHKYGSLGYLKSENFIKEHIHGETHACKPYHFYYSYFINDDYSIHMHKKYCFSRRRYLYNCSSRLYHHCIHT